jgi:hypothetical protein
VQDLKNRSCRFGSSYRVKGQFSVISILIFGGRDLILKKMITTFLGLMILLMVGCSNEEIPNHLIFEGKSEHWYPKLEIKQSKSENHFGKYNYSLSMIAEYIGENLEELERTDDLPIKWHYKIESEVEDYSGGGSYSDFQSWIGNVPGGSLTETNASEFYTPENAKIEIVIEWGTKEEVIPLKATTVEYNK